jgi:hypothetical protein
MLPGARNRLIGWASALAVFLGGAIPACAADRSLEYAVKATFLYKFAGFVEWPAGSYEHESSPFHLCVVGTDPFGGRILENAVRGQRVGRHPIVLRRLANVEPGSGCHAMFVSGRGTAEALSAVRGTPTLTVTDSSFDAARGIIRFVIVDDRVNFEIDNVAAAGSHLVISSKLLALAHRVRSRAGTTE